MQTDRRRAHQRPQQSLGRLPFLMAALLFVVIMVLSIGYQSMSILTTSAYAQTEAVCVKTNMLEFKGPSQPGDPSYITLADEPLVVGINLNIPPFSILVKSRQSETAAWAIELDAKGVVEAESEPAGLKLSGASVAIDHGEVNFNNLVIQTTPQENVTYKIIFTAKMYFESDEGDDTSATTTTAAAVVTTTAFDVTTTSPSGGSSSNSSDPSDGGGGTDGRTIIELYLRTGVLTFVSVDTASQNKLHSARLGTAGYLHHAVGAQRIPENADIPPFEVWPINIFGHVIPNLDIVVTVTSTVGKVIPSTYTGSGITTITGMTLNVTTRELPGDTSSEFYFNVYSTIDATTVTFNSGAVEPPRSNGDVTLANYIMLFTTASLFSQDNIGNTAVLGVAMPLIEIALYNSRMDTDSSNTGLIITATCAQTTLVGAEALVIKGVAQFKNLAFSAETAPNTAVITFTAGAQGNLNVNNRKLYSGTVAVTASPIKGRHMQFSETFSFLQSGVGGYLPLNDNSKPVTGTTADPTGSFETIFEISSIVVEIKDSAFQFDQTAKAIELDIVFEPAQGLTVVTPDPHNPDGAYVSTGKSSAVFEVVNGLATLNNLLVAGGKSGQTFTIRVVDALGIRATQSSGIFTLQSATLTGQQLMNDINANCRTAASSSSTSSSTIASSCQYSLSFGGPHESFIYSEAVRYDATVGETVPEVVIFLKDRFGNPITQPDSSLVPQLYAYTTTGMSGGASASDQSSDTIIASSLILSDGNSHIATWRGNRYVFRCLQFASQPNGLARVFFSVRDPTTSSSYRGVGDIRSGFFSVTSGPESRYSIAFSASSFVRYPTMPFSAVVNVAIPTITLNVLDSSGATDDGANDVEIIATANGGTLDSTTVRQRSSSGVVSFYMLRFTALADTPTITFRAVLTGKAVDGRTLTTGPITLTSRPIQSYELAFSKPYVENPTPTTAAMTADPTSLILYSGKSLTFSTIASILLNMYIVIRDSAHQVELEAHESVSFQLESEQVRLSDDGTVYTIGGVPKEEVTTATTTTTTAAATTRTTTTRPSTTTATETFTTTPATIVAVATDGNGSTLAAVATTSVLTTTTTVPSTTTTVETTTEATTTTSRATTTEDGNTTSTSPPTTVPTTTRDSSTIVPSSVLISNIRVTGIIRPSEPIFITLKVTSTTSPTMSFSDLRIGPILYSGAEATCAGLNNKPSVVFELATSMETFLENEEGFRSDIAYTMGIEDSRVTMSNLRLAQGRDFRTVNDWKGIKVDIRFDDPTRTSTNRKTSLELATELVSIDAYCRVKELAGQGVANPLPLSSISENEVTPTLKSAYFLASDRSCVVADFRAGVIASDKCNHQGDISTCECYYENVIAEHGLSCVQEPEIADELLTICKLLSTCRSTDITNVCEEVLDKNRKSYWWVWLIIGGVAVLGAGGLAGGWFLWIVKRQPKVTLNADKE